LTTPPPKPQESPQPEPHRIQLSEIWLEAARLDRRVRRATDSELPVVTARVLRRGTHDLPGVRARIQVMVPIYDKEVLSADLTIAGRLVVEAKTPRRAVSDFVKLQAFYILWPFVRVYFDQLARLAGVQLPPLPLIAVPGDILLPRARS
jgi:hypothetical protein